MLFKKRIFVAIAILLCSMAMAPPGWSQALILNSINTDTYPLIKTRFSAIDSLGKEYRIFSPQDIHITEFGQTVQPTLVQCPPIVPPNALSVVLAIDVSGSMERKFDDKTNLDFAKEAVRSFLHIFDYDISECGITSFNNDAFCVQDLTISKTKLLNSLEQLVPNGGTNYTNGLLQAKNGAIEIVKNGINKRVIIFLTDGVGEINFQQVLDSLKEYDITFYAIGLRLRLKDELRKLSDTSGGRYFEHIETEEELVSIYEEILTEVQSNSAPCEVEWISKDYCNLNTIPLTFTLPRIGATAKTTITIPQDKKRIVEFSSTQVNIGNKTIGVRFDTTIFVYARNKEFSLTDINSSNQFFAIAPTSGVISSNDSLAITISIIPTDTLFSSTVFTVKTDDCQYQVYSNAGTATLTSNTSLKLISPNGGETYGVYSDTVIRWEGVSKEEKVLLEFSTNNGASWRTISEDATNHEYKWKSIPPEASEDCLVRVSQRKQFPYPRDFTLNRSGLFGGISWSPSSSKIAFSRDAFELSVIDINTQEEKTLVIPNAFYTTSFSPNEKYVVVFGAMGIVRVIDIESMSVVNTFSANGNITNLKVSPIENTIATINSSGQLGLYTFDGTMISSVQFPVQNIGNPNVSGLFWNHNGTAIGINEIDSDSGRVYVYSIPTFQQIGYKAFITRTFYSNFFTTDNQYITTTTTYNGEVWDLATSGQVKAIPYKQYHNIMSVSNNQKYVLYFFNLFGGYTPSVYNDIQNVLVRTIPTHKYKYEIAWSPNSKYVVTTGLDSLLHFSVIEQEALQSDVSDKNFTTVLPIVQALPIELDTVELPKYLDSVVTGFLELQTPFSITIDSIGFSYAMYKNTFSIVGNSTNLHLENNKPLTVEFRFRPYFRGYIENTYSIYMGGNEIATAPIRGMAIDSIFTRLASKIDMGDVQLGSSKDSLAIRTIRNVSIRHIPIRGLRIVGSNDFTLLSSPDPFTLNRTQTLMVDIRFTPSRGGLIQAMLEIEYDGPNSPLYIPIIGVGLTDGEYVIEAGNVETTVGEIVDIPFTVRGRSKEGITTNKLISFDVDYRTSVALPMGIASLPFTNEISTVRMTNLTLKTGIIGEIKMRIGLGDQKVSIVGIRNLETNTPTDITSIDGSITLIDLCEEGGTRLLNPTGRTGVVALTVKEGRIELELDRAEAGSAQLSLTNQIGQIVYSKTLPHSEVATSFESLSTNNFSSGVYYVTFSTATTSQTVPVMIVK